MPAAFYRVRDLACQLALSEPTVRRLCAEGVIPSVKVGKAVLVSRRLWDAAVEAVASGRAATLADALAPAPKERP